ncbi:hypothetical protein SPRG_08207 [Saprolegnia parasitica CBS 223.65]|uniref:Transcriptional regulator n=1 Tax=Saprolegnia parasitica (strain CBS 223.65) TaxID=695850 RepID=A0A067C6J9_SAPPC|nr:hypothetical protein SPRG_08207 [Saprolegnia parasitica CBS 223.65]KDO26404.1 hypothetical protein SPRG_08207 [Saprolegnia parasitica CBS 223.65]|eukprot:XP_012202842.1 hypothetical protein SPRG_08207 [Saprolegnia parasitica CBS 223.65]
MVLLQVLARAATPASILRSVAPTSSVLGSADQRRCMGRGPTIQGKKSLTDAKRTLLFGKLAKELMVTSKLTAGDTNNIRLASVISKAKAANMPRDKIEYAVKRGVEGKSGVITETVEYEATGPHGSALIIEALTDNRKRTAPALRHILSKHNGNLGANGSVAWMFERKGYFEIQKPDDDALAWDEESVMNLAIEAGVDDVEYRETMAQLMCESSELAAVRSNLMEAGVVPQVSELIYSPKEYLVLEGDAKAEFDTLLEALQDNEDVNEVYHNVDED